MRDRRSEDPVQPPQPSLPAPWRMSYIDEIDAKEKVAGTPKTSTGCFLRDYWLAPAEDARNHVIVRSKYGLILLNRFPYAGGHLLVALGEGRPRILDYSPEERATLWALTDVALDLMERTLEPQGVNIGVNQGRAAGAGVPQHVHVHLVPRWGGDVNFMSVVGHVKVISASLEAMAERYRKVWAGMQAAAGGSRGT